MSTETDNEKILEPIIGLIKDGKANNIIVMTGAGISTSSGIPDFRTPGTGLYDNLQKYNLPMAEDIFCLEYFQENPLPFFDLASTLYPGQQIFLPTLTHHFISLLQKKSKLLRLFTQNIDGLEYLANISNDKLIECHGHFRTSTCLSCKNQIETKKVEELILKKEVPKCNLCKTGVLKPDITFFGENLPPKFYVGLELDFPKCDLLIVMGTSLQVSPFNSLIHRIKPNVPILLINKEDSLTDKFKIKKKHHHVLLSDCDKACQTLADMLGWKEDLDQLLELAAEPEVPSDDEKLLNDENSLIEDLSKLTL